MAERRQAERAAWAAPGVSDVRNHLTANAAVQDDAASKEGSTMKTDTDIRDDVIEELRWDPQVSQPENLGVAVADGAVTLSGHTTSYAEKLAAGHAAERVYGVKAVANDLEIHLAGSPRDDADVAKAIAHVLEWNVNIPDGRIQARVQNGWVTLKGHVDYDFQRREVERMVRHVRGVVGIADDLVLTPPASPFEVESGIQDAFEREADVDARQVSVEVSGHTARLYGQVDSLREAEAARAAAAAAPGVARVESFLTVLP